MKSRMDPIELWCYIMIGTMVGTLLPVPFFFQLIGNWAALVMVGSTAIGFGAAEMVIRRAENA